MAQPDAVTVPGLSELANMPPWAQVGVGIGFIGVLSFLMISQFMRGRAAPEPERSVVLEQAEVADMKAIRDLIAALDPLPDVLKAMPDLIRGINELRADTARLMARQETTWDNQRRLIEFAERQERSREVRDAIEDAFRRDEVGRHPINRDR